MQRENSFFRMGDSYFFYFIVYFIYAHGNLVEKEEHAQEKDHQFMFGFIQRGVVF